MNHQELTLCPIARVETDFAGKFGIPRQSGVVAELRARLVFEPEYRSREVVRGLEEYSHLWLIWVFSENVGKGWKPTVRPPRLGGNVRKGVFATRSPFRPNPLGLSCVELERVEWDSERGPVLHLKGADLMDGTPVLDIKPYIPYADAHLQAAGGFTAAVEKRTVTVQCAPELLGRFPEEKRAALLAVLANDPRPAYQDDAGRVYGFGFAGREVRFRVCEGVLTVLSVD